MTDGPSSELRPNSRKPVIGWREWVSLPDLGVNHLKAKVDTGARSSALHAIDVEEIKVNGKPWVEFRLHPLQRSTKKTVTARAQLIDKRWVRSSTGRRTLRPVIRTQVRLGSTLWPIEVTLVRRDVMGFRMLLGRQAIRRVFLVDTSRSFLAGKPDKPKTPSEWARVRRTKRTTR